MMRFRKLAMSLLVAVLMVAVYPSDARPDLYAGANVVMGQNSAFFYVNSDPAYLDINVLMEYPGTHTVQNYSVGLYGTYWQNAHSYQCHEFGMYHSTIDAEISVSAYSEAGSASGYASGSAACGSREDY